MYPLQSRVTLSAAIVKHVSELLTLSVRVYTVFGEFRVPHKLISTAKTCGIAKMNRKKKRKAILTLELKIKPEFRFVLYTQHTFEFPIISRVNFDYLLNLIGI